VFMIAAEGGGIYAASAAALYLSSVQDQCSDFARHVFAISGVSGGAVGATVFDAVLKGPVDPDCSPSATKPTPLTLQVDRVLRSDHLSPVLSFVLPDIASKLVPSSKHFDRAVALASSFECAFAASKAGQETLPICPLTDPSPSPMSAPFGRFWQDTLQTVPALVLNTTSVETGFRVAFAPDGMSLRTVGDGTLFAFSDVLKNINTNKPITMIQAAMASASFPLLQPPYSLTVDNRALNFVDGGYVDNSGTDTALDMFKALDKSAAEGGADLQLIVLTDTLPKVDITGANGKGFSEMISPITTLLNVRAQMSDRALKATDEYILGSDASHPAGGGEGVKRLQYVKLDQRSVALPLGWKISRTELDYVRLLLGNPAFCSDSDLLREDAAAQDSANDVRVESTIISNSCVARRVIEALVGQSISTR